MPVEPDALRLMPEKVIAACDGEQEHFEAWAESRRYDMSEHPLHYIFTDPKTDAARMGWNAALAYVRDAAAPAVQPEAGRDEIARVIRERTQIGGTDWHRNAGGADINAEELADLIAALAHPPAQEVEALRKAARALLEAPLTNTNALLDAKALARAALSPQPGPASEGGGE